MWPRTLRRAEFLAEAYIGVGTRIGLAWELLRVTEDDDVGVIGVGDDWAMRTAPLAVVSGAVVVVVTGWSSW